MTHASYRKAMAVLILGACIIGLAPIFVRLSSAGPAATGVWRLAFALPALAVLAQSGARDAQHKQDQTLRPRRPSPPGRRVFFVTMVPSRHHWKFRP